MQVRVTSVRARNQNGERSVGTLSTCGDRSILISVQEYVHFFLKNNVNNTKAEGRGPPTFGQVH